MNWIEVNGTSLRYELSGSGKTTLVLVHEMGGTLDSWDQVLPALNNTRQVLRYDTRGAGLSEKIQRQGHLRRHGRRPRGAAGCARHHGQGRAGRHRGRRRHRDPLRRASRGARRRAGGDQPGHRRRRGSPPGHAGSRRRRRGAGHARAGGTEHRQLLSAGGPPQRRGISQIPRALAGQRSAELRRDQPHAGGLHGDRGTAAHRLPHAGDRLHARQAASAVRGRADGEADSRRGIPGDQLRSFRRRSRRRAWCRRRSTASCSRSGTDAWARTSIRGCSSRP